MERVNFIEFACGMKGSGKSTLLASHAAQFPRRLIIDPVAEFFGTLPGSYECMTYAETLDALEDAAGRREWVVISCLPAKDAAKLCGVIAPENNPRAGYSLAVGGMLIECGEVETIAPNSGAISPAVGNLFHRGRHYRTSIVCATRRPRDVHRIVTSQCDAIACFRQHEPRDVDYIASLTSSRIAEHIAELEPFHHVRYMPNYNRASLVDENGKERKVIEL